MSVKQSSVDYAKELVKFIRKEIKQKVKEGDLPDITYQLTRIPKTNLQKIRINFNGKALDSQEKVKEVYAKLAIYFDKYTTTSMSDRGTIDIYSSSYLKGGVIQKLEESKTTLKDLLKM